MRIIMFGTGPFAVPTFESLLASDHDVVALYTRPIADAGKRRKSVANPSREVAERVGLPVFDPMDVNEAAVVADLKAWQADLFVVCDYGQILSAECLSTAKKGGINLHGSLLPRYRGAAPINWCLFNGDQVTGVTIIHMTPRLDGGPCLAQAKMQIDPTETTETLEPKLAQLGVQPVHDAIEQLEQWDGQSTIGVVQDPSLVSNAPRLKKSDGAIDWSRSASELVNQIRAFQPWPGSFTNWQAANRKQPVRLILHQASAEPAGDSSTPPGTIVEATADRLVVQTGDGRLSLEVIQPAGKKAMPVADFLRGNQPQIGEQLSA